VSASTDADSREIHHRIPASPDRLPELRHALSRWSAEVGMPAEQREELILASYEAMANSVEHAYRDTGEGVLDLHASCDEQGTVTVTVTDYGTWKPESPGDGLRGRGLRLIQALATDSSVERGDSGTTVTMTWTRPDPPTP
jgi:serine/threonine-protein kinase RsbW